MKIWGAAMVVGCLPCAGWGVATIHAAVLTPISQTRYVDAGATASSETQHVHYDVPDFNPFDSTATATANDSFDNTYASVTASQQSEVAARSLTASGDVTGYASQTQGYSAYGSGTSYFDISFELTEPANVLLTGTVTLPTDNFPAASIDFLGPAGTIASADAFSHAIDFSALLPPGVYELTAEADGYVDAGQFVNDVGAYDLHLNVVPEPSSFALAVVPFVLFVTRQAAQATEYTFTRLGAATICRAPGGRHRGSFAAQRGVDALRSI